MTYDQLPQNPAARFRTFRRRLANAVTVAINSNKQIRPGGPMCPLGCLPEAVAANRPMPHDPPAGSMLSVDQHVAFTEGFDGHTVRAPEQYWELGRLYRKRFTSEPMVRTGRRVQKQNRGRIGCSGCVKPAAWCEEVKIGEPLRTVAFYYYCAACWRTPGPDGTSPAVRVSPAKAEARL